MNCFADLMAADRQPVLPFEIELAGTRLLIEEWLRILPGKRYVGRGFWQSQQVVAKLFAGRGAQRKVATEIQGSALLTQAGIRTPELLGQGVSDQGGWVIYQYLPNAESLTKQLPTANDASASDTWLLAAVDLIAHMHECGLQQQDLHLDNFIVYENNLWLIDMADVQGSRTASLSEREAISNLGLFLAQLPLVIDPDLLIERYNAVARVRLQPDAVRHQEYQWRCWRARDLMAKSVRDCTLFSVMHDKSSFYAVRRDEKKFLEPLLKNPDAYIAQGTPLKKGSSATVSLVNHAGTQLVIKRYNIKNWYHAISRCWRPSRAWRSWQMANALAVLGINTPRPLAMIERRWGWLRQQAYLISCYQPEQDIIRHTQEQLDPRLEQALVQMMEAMQRNRLSHGDLKGTNLLYGDGRLSVIDLDAAILHRSTRRFDKAYSKDRSRLLANWPQQHPVRQRLDQVLPGANK